MCLCTSVHACAWACVLVLETPGRSWQGWAFLGNTRTVMAAGTVQPGSSLAHRGQALGPGLTAGVDRLPQLLPIPAASFLFLSLCAERLKEREEPDLCLTGLTCNFTRCFSSCVILGWSLQIPKCCFASLENRSRSCSSLAEPTCPVGP